jgi:hypothetical protein
MAPIYSVVKERWLGRAIGWESLGFAGLFKTVAA